MSESVFRKIKLMNKVALTGDVFEFVFEKPDQFDFVPGQFVQMRLPAGEKAILRSYSISSSREDEFLQFCIKIIPDGTGSAVLDKIKAGDTVEISEPKGRFGSFADTGTKYFIATGVGVAPIMSMLEGEEVTKDKLLLIFGVRYESDLFWLERFKKLKEKNINFDHLVTVSRPSDSWMGKKGRVVEHLPVEHNAHYYICGSLPVVKDVRQKLLASGVGTKSIHIEIF